MSSDLKFKWRLKFRADYHQPSQFQVVESNPDFDSKEAAQEDMVNNMLANPKDYSPDYEFEIIPMLDGKEVRL